MRVAVIGAGPMGIAAAIGAVDRGHDVTVLERDSVGASLLGWGPVRFFSPFRMNVSPRMRELLGSSAPADDALLTGPDYVERVLLPLADSPILRGRIRTATRVVALGRRGLTRADYAGHPLRAERPFRIACHDDSRIEADAILDASGGYILPRAMGAGGLPVPGEQRLRNTPLRTLGALHTALPQLRGKRVLLVGDGHSAANALQWLSALGAEYGTSIVWAVRGANRRPCQEVASDPLPERQAVVARANALAEKPPSYLRVERKAMVESLVPQQESALVTLSGGREFAVDAIAAFTGYRPDASFLTELTVETSPVSEGGARLHRAIATITDCLSVPTVTPEALESGEPGFYFVGSRSYGRSNTFLLATGLAQLEVILGALGS
jgi:thioredoxin reductase